jgi:pSer/pThr/pTyr-binding forkhead associated (FHA) protein
MSEHRPLKIADAMLVIVAGSATGQTVALDQARLIIGYEADCAIKLSDSECSRHHAVILCDAYTVRIRDLGSRNGTFVNGKQILAATVLNTADEVRIGNTVMLVCPNERSYQPSRQVSQHPAETANY